MSSRPIVSAGIVRRIARILFVEVVGVLGLAPNKQHTDMPYRKRCTPLGSRDSNHDALAGGSDRKGRHK